MISATISGGTSAKNSAPEPHDALHLDVFRLESCLPATSESTIPTRQKHSASCACNCLRSGWLLRPEMTSHLGDECIIYTNETLRQLHSREQISYVY